MKYTRLFMYLSALLLIGCQSDESGHLEQSNANELDAHLSTLTAVPSISVTPSPSAYINPSSATSSSTALATPVTSSVTNATTITVSMIASMTSTPSSALTTTQTITPSSNPSITSVVTSNLTATSIPSTYLTATSTTTITLVPSVTSPPLTSIPSSIAQHQGKYLYQSDLTPFNYGDIYSFIQGFSLSTQTLLAGSFKYRGETAIDFGYVDEKLGVKMPIAGCSDDSFRILQLEGGHENAQSAELKDCDIYDGATVQGSYVFDNQGQWQGSYRIDQNEHFAELEIFSSAPKGVIIRYRNNRWYWQNDHLFTQDQVLDISMLSYPKKEFGKVVTTGSVVYQNNGTNETMEFAETINTLILPPAFTPLYQVVFETSNLERLSLFESNPNIQSFNVKALGDKTYQLKISLKQSSGLNTRLDIAAPDIQILSTEPLLLHTQTPQPLPDWPPWYLRTFDAAHRYQLSLEEDTFLAISDLSNEVELFRQDGSSLEPIRLTENTIVYLDSGNYWLYPVYNNDENHTATIELLSSNNRDILQLSQAFTEFPPPKFKHKKIYDSEAMPSNEFYFDLTLNENSLISVLLEVDDSANTFAKIYYRSLDATVNPVFHSWGNYYTQSSRLFLEYLPKGTYEFKVLKADSSYHTVAISTPEVVFTVENLRMSGRLLTEAYHMQSDFNRAPEGSCIFKKYVEVNAYNFDFDECGEDQANALFFYIDEPADMQFVMTGTSVSKPFTVYKFTGGKDTRYSGFESNHTRNLTWNNMAAGAYLLLSDSSENRGLLDLRLWIDTEDKLKITQPVWSMDRRAFVLPPASRMDQVR